MDKYILKFIIKIEVENVYNNEILKRKEKIINEENIIERLNIEDEKGILTYNEIGIIGIQKLLYKFYKNIYIEKEYYETLDIIYLVSKKNKIYIII